MDGIKEKLIELLCHALNKYNPCIYCVGEEHCDEVNIVADHLIANGVKIREKGEWIHDPLSSYGVHVWFCSQCNGEVIRQTDYCPHCGAEMEVEHESD